MTRGQVFHSRPIFFFIPLKKNSGPFYSGQIKYVNGISSINSSHATWYVHIKKNARISSVVLMPDFANKVSDQVNVLSIL